jgi:hypothetical protein
VTSANAVGIEINRTTATIAIMNTDFNTIFKCIMIF